MSPSGLEGVFAPQTGPRQAVARLQMPAPLPAEPREVPAAEEPVVALPDADPQPERQLPPDVAMLMVTRNGDERFILRGSSALGDLDAERALGARQRPNLSLSSVFHELAPRQAIDLMDAWSRGLTAMSEWIAELRGQLEDKDLQLVIVDETGFEIPWELFSVPIEGARRRRAFIGAVVPVTRLPIRVLEAEEPASMLSSNEEGLSGGVLAYLSNELSGIASDKAALDTLAGRGYDDLAEFESHLKDETGDFALVYMACHGTPAGGLGAALGSGTNRGKKLVLGTLQREGIPLVERCRSAVILNACHSARLSEDVNVKDGLLYGFPSVFLREGALGVIGTTGEVLETEAPKMAQGILSTLRDADAPLATVLQRQRGAVADAYAEGGVSDEALVCAFMYVYYGHPRCRVAIG